MTRVAYHNNKYIFVKSINKSNDFFHTKYAKGKKYDSLLLWLKAAEFSLSHQVLQFITWNRSFNFEKSDRANPYCNTEVLRSVFPLQWESHLLRWHLLRPSLFSLALDFLIFLWQTHLVSCHLGLILHCLDMFPIQKDLEVCQVPLNAPRRMTWGCKVYNYNTQGWQIIEKKNLVDATFRLCNNL